ncbi:hypothetical protein E2562_011995 [Oryza meyeriana var. granulata]|uniref:F-box domain-containing protein n=1 Tax=Oryza meyeriana var. granulata TaxID=110450 RepID=A0A6G1F735_9ORYZ|nr:hypothetical protein E2562_011995 [Oryza meyeriana var. granulata]
MPASSPRIKRRRPLSPPQSTQPLELLDLLTALPDEMAGQILSRLPTRDAVRTSALARGWCRR